MVASVTLAACESGDALNLQPVPGFDGLVATGEPNAAIIAREVLARGGTVADAAVAVTFSLVATYPSRISLAGGGVCLIHDREKQITEALSFLPLANATGGVPPGLTRGLEALHARYGGLNWQEMVSPGEAFARFGVETSRALAADVAAAQSLLAQDPAAAQLLLPGGRPLAMGAPLRQPALAATLAGIRKQGSAYFLSGPAGPAFAAASTAAGAAMREVDLRDRVPLYQRPIRLVRGSEFIFFSPPPAANGLVAATLYQILADVADYEDEDEIGRRQHVFIEASAQSYADRGGWLTAEGGSTQAVDTLLDSDTLDARLSGLGQQPHRPSSSLVPSPRQVVEPVAGTGFVVGDRYGNAVACSLTNNGLFGSGKLDATSGIFFAAEAPGNLVISPVAAIATSIGTQRARFAGAAAGGSAGATALSRLMADIFLREMPLRTAMNQVRVHHNGLPDVAFVEERADGSVQQVLVELGHRLQLVPGLGEVQAWLCPEGILQAPGLCQVEADPRGFGLSQVSP